MIKFSIITVNLNNANGLQKTIQSVIEQSFKDYEFIVIDGGSSDGSIAIIEEHKKQIDFWVFEPDDGVYQAMNKGISNANGKYLLFMNSGDQFAGGDVLLKVNEKIKSDKDIYYGNVITERFTITPPEKLSFDFFYRSTLPHQGTFTKKELFEKVFYFNEKLKIVSDWEFFINAICKFQASYQYLNMNIALYELGGISSDDKLLQKEKYNSLQNHFSFFIEDYKELRYLKNYFKRRRFKLLIELENHAMTRKLNSVFLISLSKIVNLFKL